MRTWRSIWRTWPVSHCSFPLPPSTAAFNYHLPRPSSTATFHCHLPPPPSTAHLPPPPSTATFHCHPSTATFHWPFSLALFVARSVQPTRATSTGTSSGSGPPRSGRSVRRCGTKEMINPRARPAGVSSLWSRRCRTCPARSPGPIRPWPACTARSPTLLIGGSFSRLARALSPCCQISCDTCWPRAHLALCCDRPQPQSTRPQGVAALSDGARVSWLTAAAPYIENLYCSCRGSQLLTSDARVSCKQPTSPPSGRLRSPTAAAASTPATGLQSTRTSTSWTT